MPRARRRSPPPALLAAMALNLLWPQALRAADLPAASTPAAGIYTCVDDKGRKLTSDRPIPDCLAREQRLLNKDGSLRQVVPPTMTADERAEKEAAERRAAQQRAANADAVRRDRNLMNRYPDEATHQKARASALDTLRQAISTTELRVKALAQERKPLEDEAEFYKGRAMPVRLRQQLDANDAAVQAQREAAQNQSAELVRINQLYDLELERLKRLWAGASPGSLGPAPPIAPITPMPAGGAPGAAKVPATARPSPP